MRRAPSEFSASPLPPDPETPIFRTTNLGFAAAALTADLMSYIGAEPSGNPRDAVFVLSDPSERGEVLLKQFNAGIFPRVNPKLFLEARGFLQGEVQRVRAIVVSGDYRGR